MDGIAAGITRHRKLILLFFIVLTVVCAVLFLGVRVNYDITAYLPEGSESTIALDIMSRDFDSGVPNARVMTDELTLAEARETKELIAAAPGVTGVMWLDDVLDTRTPIETADAGLVEQYYRDGRALYSVTVAEDLENEAVDAIRAIVGEDGALSGNAVSVAESRRQVVSEVVGAACLVVPVIVLLLLLTTSSWISPLLFLLTIGVAVIINMGTNAYLDDVSYITQSVSPILQLAVSLDYAIFLLSSFERFRKTEPTAELAMRRAIRQAFASIAASAATTVFGFLALMFMRFRIGSDLGLNLVKGVFISYVSVMVFLPALALSLVKTLDRTRHRRLIPEFSGIGRALVKIRVPALILVILLVVPCYLAQSRADFFYGNGAPDADSRYGMDNSAINERFGESTAIVLLVPRGEPGREAELCSDLRALPHVSTVVSYASTVGSSIPADFLDESITANFYSAKWARIILYTDTGEEGTAAFALVDGVRAAAARLYDESYSCGQSANLRDIRDVITGDSRQVNLLAIGFIVLTLLVTFRSLTLPALLLFTIESAIWINLATPYFTDQPLVYIGYLVINTVQLGATIDYAILITDGYREHRRYLTARGAVESSLSDHFVSVLTSALTLAAAGLGLRLESSMEVVVELGMLLARGTLLSLMTVLLALPALLILFDPLTVRLTYKAGFLRAQAADEPKHMTRTKRRRRDPSTDATAPKEANDEKDR